MATAISGITFPGSTEQYNFRDTTKVPTTTTVNGHDLSSNVSVTKSDVGLGNVTNESKATMFSSAALTGTPTAPTATAGTNTTQIATTAFVNTSISGKMNSANPTGTGTFAVGDNVTASGTNSHAEGSQVTASGFCSHAECNGTTASGDYSHAEGFTTTSSGSNSHAEGYMTTASLESSHAEGVFTITGGARQHVQGKYNVKSSDYADIIGNGTSDSARSNASALDWNGNLRLKGDVYIGCNADSSGGTKVDISGKADKLSVTAGTAGTTSAQTPSYNSTFNIPYVTVNEQGLVSAYGTSTVKIPASDNTNTTLSGICYCSTAAATQAKVGTMPGFALSSGQRILLQLVTTSTVANATLNVNGTGARTIRISSAATTTSNFTAGWYIATSTYSSSTWYWDVTKVYLSDTTYSSKTAASGGTDVSLVTTGEKYTWNNKASTSAATTSANGLMTSTMVTKLNGIAEGATKVTVDSALSSTSTNAIQNKVVNTALSGKLSTSGGTLNGSLNMGSTTSGHTINAYGDIHTDSIYPIGNTDSQINFDGDGTSGTSLTIDGCNGLTLQSTDGDVAITGTNVTVNGSAVATKNSTVQYLGNFGSLTLSEIYSTYGNQNSAMYKGYFDWQDTRSPNANTCEITLYDYSMVALTMDGKFYKYSSGAWSLVR